MVYVKIKTIQPKNKAVYRKEIVGKDNRVTICTMSGKRIHKANIKNLKKHSSP